MFFDDFISQTFSKLFSVLSLESCWTGDTADKAERALPSILWKSCKSWADLDCEAVWEIEPYHSVLFALLSGFFVFNVQYTTGCSFLFSFLESLLHLQCKQTRQPSVALFMAYLTSQNTKTLWIHSVCNQRFVHLWFWVKTGWAIKVNFNTQCSASTNLTTKIRWGYHTKTHGYRPCQLVGDTTQNDRWDWHTSGGVPVGTMLAHQIWWAEPNKVFTVHWHVMLWLNDLKFQHTTHKLSIKYIDHPTMWN